MHVCSQGFINYIQILLYCLKYKSCCFILGTLPCKSLLMIDNQSLNKSLLCFLSKRKQQTKQSSVDSSTMVTGVSNLIFKFDVTLDILEEDNKGFSSAARDKNCFKLRQDLRKKVSVTVQQLTNKHLIVERSVVIMYRFIQSHSLVK